MKRFSTASYTQYLAGALLVCLGMFVGWVLALYGPWQQQLLADNRGAVLHQSDISYQYIGPLLSCDIGTEEAFPEMNPIRSALTEIITKEKNAGNASDVSVYVRLLKSARWFDINEGDTYAPASLLKVFIMMAYYKEDDDVDNSSVLDRHIVFEGSANLSQDEPGEMIPHLVNGRAYTVAQVIDQMIIYSDNDAMNTLVDNFDSTTLKEFKNIFSDLHIPSPLNQSESAMNFMSVDDYAMVFRVLYGSTYLSRGYSEKALALLSKAHYAGGVVAGVPRGTTVAHKFGVRSIPPVQNGGTSGVELHDCGIVYYPNHPVLLCIMSRGSDFAKLQTALQDVSHVAYQQLDIFFKTTASTTVSTVAPVARPH